MAETFYKCGLIWDSYRWRLNFVPMAHGHMGQKRILITLWVKLYEKGKNLNFPKSSAQKRTVNSSSTIIDDCAGCPCENTEWLQKMQTTVLLLWTLSGNIHPMRNGFFHTNNTDRLCSFTGFRQVHSLPLMTMVQNSPLLRLIKG